jgi:arylsulfatase A-like enzyme
MKASECPECGHESDADQRVQRILRWAVAIVYIILIASFSTLVLPLWHTINQILGSAEKSASLVNWGVLIIGGGTLAYLSWKFRPRRPEAYAWLLAVVAAYSYLLALHCQYPVERAHLVQYSLLAWLVFRAVRIDWGRGAAVASACVGVLIVGTFDELLQGIIPGRSSSLEDMVTNWSAGSLGLIGMVALQGDRVWAFSPSRRVLRFSVGLLIPLAFAAVGAHQIWTRHFHPPLNLIVITVDCLRPDRMSLLGYSRETTPFMDASVKQGALFVNAYSQAAWTGAGVVSTLSGLYPPTHGVVRSGVTIPESVNTLLDEFSDRGYRVPNMSYLTVDPTFQNLGQMEEKRVISPETYDEIAEIRNWIDLNHDDSFAIWFHWRHLHLPYEIFSDQENFPPADEITNVPPEAIRELIQKEVIIPEGTFQFEEEHREWIDALYDSQILWFDRFYEMLRYRLRLHNKLENTIIVITADHGEELLEHGHVGHASTAVHSKHYDEHIRIPLIILCPRLIDDKVVFDVPAQQVDILPTVLDMMGWEIPETAQGRSLWPAIQGRPMKDVPVFAESIEGGYQSKPHQQNTWVRSVRTRDWKLITRTSPEAEELELYHLAEDPDERHNVVDTESEMAEQLRAMLDTWLLDNQLARAAVDEREQHRQLELAADEPENLDVPSVLEPLDGATLFFEAAEGYIKARWTGNPHARYVVEYDVGEGWHRIQNTYLVPERGTEHAFGPIPRDAWKPLPQWNPYRLRVRPLGLPDGWSEWVTIDVAPLGTPNAPRPNAPENPV